ETDQPQLFPEHRENKIGMGFGQIKELLLALHQSHARKAAGRNRNQRLNDVETAPLRVSIRVQESQNAIATVRNVEDCKIEQWQGTDEGVSKVFQIQARDKQNADGYGTAGNRGAEVGLKYDQAYE